MGIYWREQISKYQVWHSGTKYRGVMILVKKNSGCTFSNEFSINEDALLVDFSFPGGKIVNAACVYGPSHKDDGDFWKLVKYHLDLRNSPDGKMILGDFNVTLNFARDTQNYLTDPHKKARIVINQWIFNGDLVDVFEELHPGRSSYTWSRSADILRRDGDPNVRNVARGKQSRIDHILISPTLMHAVKNIEHVNYGRRVSDHSAVILTLDWAETDKGQGVFRCGAETHKNKNYQELMHCSFYKSIIDYIDNPELQDDLRVKINQILKLTIKRNKISNDLEIDPAMKEDTLFVLEDTIRALTRELPDLQGIIATHVPGKAMNALVFLLTKAAEDTRRFNKQAAGTRSKERVKILANLNTVLQNPQSTVHEIEDAEAALIAFDEEDIRKILLKNENFRMFDDEKSSKAFLTLENCKSQYNNNVSHLEVVDEVIDNTANPPKITKIKTTSTDPKKILKEFQKQFQAIYDHQPGVNGSEEEIKKFLNSDGDTKPYKELLKRIKKITKQEFQDMEGELSDHELTETLMNSMNGASAPGIDGFTVGWLRQFWPMLRHLVRMALNEMYDEAAISEMCRLAIIRLLRKGEKSPLLPGNYRPISLLSIFYKLASACITKRIKPVLARLIGKEQKAYLPENNIGSVIMNLINMIHFCNTKKKEALILLVDFQKAFDSINHQYINSVLKMYGFGESIRKWIRIFFNKREAVILLGGHLSEKIFLRQGVPQGDVISPYIFLMVVEFLSIKINYTKNLTGVVFAKNEARSEFFADDLSAMVLRTEENLRYFSRILDQFHAVSGLKCNLDKTFVVPVGNFAKGPMCVDLNLKWVDSFTVLGITIDNKLKQLQDNFQTIYEKVDKKIGTWIRYGLTFQGRITVAKR